MRCVDSAFLDYLFDRGGKVAKFGDCVWLICAGDACLGPCAEAPRLWVCIGECDVGCSCAVYNRLGRFIGCVVVGNARVGFDFADVCNVPA